MSFRPCCFALRCAGKRDPHALMCAAHWGMVSPGVRARLARYLKTPVRVDTGPRAHTARPRPTRSRRSPRSKAIPARTCGGLGPASWPGASRSPRRALGKGKEVGHECVNADVLAAL